MEGRRKTTKVRHQDELQKNAEEMKRGNGKEGEKKIKEKREKEMKSRGVYCREFSAGPDRGIRVRLAFFIGSWLRS